MFFNNLTCLRKLELFIQFNHWLWVWCSILGSVETQRFLEVRLSSARCRGHTRDQWTQQSVMMENSTHCSLTNGHSFSKLLVWVAITKNVPCISCCACSCPLLQCMDVHGAEHLVNHFLPPTKNNTAPKHMPVHWNRNFSELVGFCPFAKNCVEPWLKEKPLN